MSNNIRRQLLTCCADNFFDEAPIFSGLANELGDSSFFITGATGLFGSWIINFLHWATKRGFAEPRVMTLVRREKPFLPNICDVIKGDIKNFEPGNQKFDYLLHLAAPSASETFGGMSDLDKFDMLNIGTRQILNFAQSHVTRRVLVTSSGAVYGGFDRKRFDPISEEERVSLPYNADMQGLGLGKKVLEFITREYCLDGRVDASIARCFSFIGPGLPTNLHYAAGNFVSNAVNCKNIVINGDGLAKRSFMHLGDMVLWLFRILFNGRIGEDYNVGSAEVVSIRQLAEITRSLAGGKIDIDVIGSPNDSIGIPPNFYYVPSVKKAVEQLGLVHSCDLRSSLQDFIEFERNLISEQ